MIKTNIGLAALVSAAIGMGATLRRVDKKEDDTTRLSRRDQSGPNTKPEEYYRKRNVPKKLRVKGAHHE